MNIKKQRIGGEFWYHSSLYDSTISNLFTDDMIFLNGGKSSIKFILNTIDIQPSQFIALPSYLCPSIVDIFENLNINYKFYSINKNFEINIDKLDSLVKNKNIFAVFFINYFGFFYNNKTKSYLSNLKEKGILLIEDAVHCFYLNREDKFIGDFVFNSYRKFLPIDGSIILSNKKYKAIPIKDSYFYLIERSRKFKKAFIKGKNISEELILKEFEKAHKNYYLRDNFYSMNHKYQNFLKHFPKDFLSSKRLENYIYLFQNLKFIKEIEFVFKDLPSSEVVPLSFPIFIKNRDYIRKKLMEYNIFAPIHWSLENCSWLNDFDDSIYMSSNLLSLPIDWRYSISDMEYLVNSLSKIILSQTIKEKEN